MSFGLPFLDAVSVIGLLAGLYALVTLVAHILSSILAVRGTRPLDPPAHCPPVSLIRPLCRLHPHVERTIASSFELEWPAYEVIFCVADADDPVIALVRKAANGNPDIPSRLLIGREDITHNPKLNNLAKGWRAAIYPTIVMVDSNVLMTRHSLAHMIADLQQVPGGMAASPPQGIWPEGWQAELECSLLNGYQLRWQLAADALGYGFVQGKAMAFNRSLLGEDGLEALAGEFAEDAAATRRVRSLGKSVSLIHPPVLQPVGDRSLAAVWQRQGRWAQLRRSAFPWQYFAELASMAAVSVLAASFAFGWWALAYVALWYLAEILCSRACGWAPVGWRQLAILPVRDLALPVVWMQGWLCRAYHWHGHSITIDESLLPDTVTKP